MKTIIAGSRHINDYEALKKAIDLAEWDITEVVSGNCRGVDCMGEQWAEENGVPVKVFPADWITYGRTAGELRNRQMAEYADGLILLWDGRSPGASCMLRESTKAGIEIHSNIYGMDMKALDDHEQDILKYYWEGRGRLIYVDGHWSWEEADAEAPEADPFAIMSLVRKGLMQQKEVTLLVPKPSH